MRNLTFIVFFFTQTTIAQINSLKETADSVKIDMIFSGVDTNNLPVLDSLKNLASFKWVKDSLTVESWSLSMMSCIQNKFNTDSLQLLSQMDSLSSLQLPTLHYERKLDSLRLSKQNMLNELNGKQEELLNKTRQNISSWKMKVQSRIDSLGIAERIPNLNIPDAALPDVNISNATISSVPVASLQSFDLPKIPELSFNDFSEMDLSPDLSEVNNKLPFNTSEGLTGIQESLTGIKEKFSALDKLKSNPDKAIEKAVSSLEGVNALGELKNPIEQLPANNPDAVKEKLKEQAANHFAGKEELLTKSMEQISKYKQKYSSVQSIKDLPKKVPNEIKGKPLIERLIPGVSFQYQFNNNYLLDIYSYAGYRLTGRITTGIGWNQRVARDQDNSYWNHKGSIYGPRIFGNYRLDKGFTSHIEAEIMNTFVSYNRTDPEAGKREWVWSTMTGLKKEYRITKNLKGTVLVLYNIFDPKRKSPYNDRLNTRIGVEYRIKKNQKEKREI